MPFAFTDKDEFYPTPKTLANRMCSKVSQSNYGGRWLEPCAGRGDLIDAVMNKYGSYGYRQPKVDAIEIDPDLQSLLKGKDYNVIHDDFMTFTGRTQYDVIIMNPPFSRDVDFLLRAWDHMYNGEIVCLLNAQSIRNPFSDARKRACQIIEEHGTVEYIQDAFMSADRSTGVEVALVHLTKVGDIQGDFFSGMSEGGNHAPAQDVEDTKLAIAGRSIENIVETYNAAIEHGISAIIKQAEANYYISLLGGKGTARSVTTQEVSKSVNQFVDETKAKAWSYVIHSTDFRSVTTDKVRRQLESDMENLKRIEFTANNIRQFLINLIEDQESIMRDCVESVFDEFTRYHPENRVHLEGWKSNDYFLVGKRVVLPFMFEASFAGGIDLTYNGGEKLSDIDRVMAYLDGKRAPEVPIVVALKEARASGGIAGRKIISSYFEIRGYNKGTIHLRFRDKDLLDRLNIIAGRAKGWLPEKDSQIPKEFWLINSK